MLSITTQCSVSNVNIELIRYINQKNPAGVQCVIKKGADINGIWNSQTPLMFAINKLKLESVLPKEWKKKCVLGLGLLAGSGLTIATFILCIAAGKNRKKVFKEWSALEEDYGTEFIINEKAPSFIFKTTAAMLVGGAAICATGLAIKLLRESFNNFMIISKEIDQMIIIEILIDHPDSHVDLAVNGVTALSMVDTMITEEKDLLIKNKLEVVKDLIQKRIAKDQEAANIKVAA